MQTMRIRSTSNFFNFKLFTQMHLRQLIIIFNLLISIFYIPNIQSQNPPTTIEVQMLNEAVRKVTDVIVHDVFTPPVASRIYAYSTIAAYEIMQMESDIYVTYAGKLNQLFISPPPQHEIIIPLASVSALFNTAKGLLFSEQMIEEHLQNITLKYYPDSDSLLIAHSLAHGKAVAQHILEWAAEDNYKSTRSYNRYTLLDAPWAWEPTPPDYADGIEPHWKYIRPFTLDSAAQFKPVPPTNYTTEKNSPFYNEALEVYQISQTLTEEQKLSVQFWDDNPFTTYYVGHLQYAHKKITPGGHWIDITREAITTSGCDMVKAAYAYSAVAIALADGFISCWDEKYRSNLLRPETYINRYIDQQWRPYLQTPPFPEYTSGHSVISASAATVLTALFGNSFSFTDRIETEYDLPPITFASFLQAAEDAAYSRLYGGIHYRPGIEVGIMQGTNVGNFVVGKIKEE